MKYLVIANKMAVPRELEELGNESGYLKSMVQFYKTKKKVDGGCGGCTKIQMYLIPLNN